MSVQVMSKTLFASKLFWLGVIQIVVGAADLIKTNVLDSDTAAWAAVGTGIVTIILRLLTQRPATITPEVVEIEEIQ